MMIWEMLMLAAAGIWDKLAPGMAIIGAAALVMAVGRIGWLMGRARRGGSEDGRA